MSTPALVARLVKGGMLCLIGFVLIEVRAADMPVGHPMPAKPVSATDLQFFETKVRPVLVNSCYKCHSKEADKIRGGFMIDTPGMRELQLWDVRDAVSETFDEIEALASNCRFTDCRHRDEPRCAVKAAVEEGKLSAARLESYLKVQDELGYLARQQDERAQLDEKRRNKIVGKALKQHLKTKRD